MRRFLPMDIGQINSWLQLRDMPALMPKQLPKIGYIIDDVACGFLYQTDSSVCYVEQFVAHPNAENKQDAINKIVTQLLVDATALNFEVAIAITKNETIKQIANKQNCIYIDGFTLITKQL